MKGKLIVFDGGDGGGKHTQSEMLRTHLLRMGLRVLFMSFPRYEDTFFGRELKKALAGNYGDFVALDPHLASIPYAADRWASKCWMKETLEGGGYAICDRYASANQIHQGGKIEDEAERVDFLAWLNQLEYGEFGIPKPDVSIYLDVPPAVSHVLMSDKTRDIVENNPQYIENSYKSAQWLMSQEPDLWIHVRCTVRGLMRTRDSIHEEIVSKLKSRGIF